MIPDDAKQCKEAELDKTLKAQQKILGDHFGLADEVIPYSEKVFEFEALAIKWLVYTNQVLFFPMLCFSLCSDCLLHQPIHAFKYQCFKKMLDMASQASHGVMLPTPKKTHSRIIHMFKQQMFLLHSHLNISLIIFTPFFSC